MADPKRCDRCPCPNLGHTRDDGTCLTVGCPCPGYAPLTGTWPVIDGPPGRHGYPCCIACGRQLLPGQPYSERLDAISPNSVVTEIACVYCTPITSVYCTPDEFGPCSCGGCVL